VSGAPIENVVGDPAAEDVVAISPKENVEAGLRAVVTDTGNVNEFVGGNQADIINGEGGNDQIRGNEGNDKINGGAGSADTAVYESDRDEYTVELAPPHSSGFVTGFASVTDDGPSGMDEGIDELSGIERLEFADTVLDLSTSSVQLFDGDPLGSGTLIGTFDSIQDALDLAANGQFILVNGTGPGSVGGAPQYTDSDETITISDGVTIRGLGSVTLGGVIIADSALASSNVTLDNLDVVSGVGSPSTGINFVAADGNATGTLTVTNSSVSGFSGAGLITSSTSGLTDITVLVSDSTFSGNGTNGLGGETDINLFNFAGDATLTNVTVSGGNGGVTDHAIQISGFTGSSAATGNIEGAIGTIDLNNVTVTGTYEKTLVYIGGYNDLTGLDFIGGLNLGSAMSSAAWAALYIEPISAGGAVTADPDSLSDIDLTGVDVLGGSFGTSPAFALYGDSTIVVVGTPGDDTVTGTSEDEGYLGAGGNDTIDAGGGNDVILQGPGGGTDVIDGGAGADSVTIANVVPSGGSFIPNPIATTITISDSGDNSVTSVDDSNGTTDVSITVDVTGMPSVASSVTMDNVEDITVILGSGGDTVEIGDLTGTAIETSTITVLGGTGSDTVDAGAISSGNPVSVVFDGGAGIGNDTFVSGAGNDIFLGGAGSDTLDLSMATSAVVATAGAGAVTATGIGSDTYSGVDNLIGGSAGDTLTGNGDANILAGGEGADTITGAGGSNTIFGGGTDGSDDASSSIDTAVYTGGATIAWNDTTKVWSVAHAGGTDTLDGIERVEIDGQVTWLVDQDGNSALGTIADALDEAASGDTVLVADGLYVEALTIDQGVTLLSANGRDFTTIENDGTANGAAISLVDGADNVQIGATGKGFTIEGHDSSFTASDYAAISIYGGGGAFSGLVIQGNDVVADGEGGLTTIGGADNPAPSSPATFSAARPSSVRILAATPMPASSTPSPTTTA
jgi:hypothetical protein